MAPLYTLDSLSQAGGTCRSLRQSRAPPWFPTVRDRRKSGCPDPRPSTLGLVFSAPPQAIYYRETRSRGGFAVPCGPRGSIPSPWVQPLVLRSASPSRGSTAPRWPWASSAVSEPGSSPDDGSGGTRHTGMQQEQQKLHALHLQQQGNSPGTGGSGGEGPSQVIRQMSNDPGARTQLSCLLSRSY